MVRIVSAIVSCYTVWVVSAMAQSGAPKQSRFADRLQPMNQWQLVPQTPAPTPSNSSERTLREARDRYADKLGAHMPLDVMEDKRLVWGQDYGPPHGGELLPGFTDRNVVVATFRDFDVVLTPSRSAIYTELQLTVERVLASTNYRIASGNSITGLMMGGTIKLPTGRQLRFLARPAPFVPVPGRRYIFFLRYVTDGDFYLIRKTIELSGGRALPNSYFDLQKAETGTWPYLDKDEEDVLREITAALALQRGAQK